MTVAALSSLAKSLLARSEVLDSSRWSISKSSAPSLKDLEQTVKACSKCPLGKYRLNPAFGVGSLRAQVMFIGEGPGFDEDHKGEPFVGKAGQLLDRILGSIGLSRDSVYIANIVKCHPMIDPTNPEKRGNDRAPSQEEINACKSYLDQQIKMIRPKYIVTLGAVATKVMLGTSTGITRLRGKWTTLHEHNISLLPTYHPAALLRNPELKRDVWRDMKNLKHTMESATND